MKFKKDENINLVNIFTKAAIPPVKIKLKNSFDIKKENIFNKVQLFFFAI